MGGICELKSYSSTVQNTVYVVRASPERNLGVWGSLRREVFFALRGVAGESRLDFGGVVGERSRDFFGAIALVDAVNPCSISTKIRWFL